LTVKGKDPLIIGAPPARNGVSARHWQEERPTITWVPENSEYLKPYERELARLVDLVRSGLNPPAIAKKMGRSANWVRSKIKLITAI